jgi:hypothetical protein
MILFSPPRAPAAQAAFSPDFGRVLRYCAKWGIEVRFEKYRAPWPWPEGTAWFDAPTALAHIEWPARRIWWDPVSCGDTDAAVALLHELSHCVDPKSPEDTDELEGPFLAFEYYSTRLLKVAGRTEWMRHYGLGDTGALVQAPNEDWGQLPVRAKAVLIRRSLARAVEVGTLTAEGRPTYRLDMLHDKIDKLRVGTHPSPKGLA